VLKDGQIVEQGTHTELLALDGIFATMWANQISTSGGDLPPSVASASLLPEVEIAGYSVEPDLSAEANEEVADQGEMADTLADAPPQEDMVGSPEPDLGTTSQVLEEPETTQAVEDPPPPVPVVPESAAPIAFPASEPVDPPTSPVTAEPLTFPVADDASATELERTASNATPGVTFETGLASPTTSPDPDAEPKRKRISSQNFQRLARRISLTTRRQGSTSSMASIIPGLKRDKTSVDDNSVRGEGSGRNSTDSPTASLSDKGKLKKKDKKDKRKSSS
jgi:ATP-binding cassette subfamily B (MDR/TAP) protein 6